MYFKKTITGTVIQYFYSYVLILQKRACNYSCSVCDREMKSEESTTLRHV
jgi:hypothetical protein